MDEVDRWNKMSSVKRIIYTTLLQDMPEFADFLNFVNLGFFKSIKAETLAHKTGSKLCFDNNYLCDTNLKK